MIAIARAIEEGKASDAWSWSEKHIITTISRRLNRKV